MRPGDVTVVIPTLNEAGSIGRLIAEILPQAGVARVIVCDGGSTDATLPEAETAGAAIIRAGRGYGRACLTGATAAAPGQIVVFMDGDGADDPAGIASLAEPLRAGMQDFVIGSRTRGPREPGAMAWHQIAAGYGAGAAIRLLYGARYTDMCAFRAIRRETLLGLGLREATYGWNVEMQMRAARAGLRILEVPVRCRRRTAGTSKVAGSVRGTLEAGFRIITTMARIAAAPAARPGIAEAPRGAE